MKFYKPTKSTTGYATGWNFNSADGKVFASFIKQTGWDDSKRVGSFKGGKQITLTFAMHEVGAILNCIERGLSKNLFHHSAKGDTSIKLAPYVKNDVKDGFTISIHPKAAEGEEPEKFGFMFNNDEARVLRQWLEFALSHFFIAEYSAEKQRRKEYAQGKADREAGAKGAPKPAQNDEEF